MSERWETRRVSGHWRSGINWVLFSIAGVQKVQPGSVVQAVEVQTATTATPSAPVTATPATAPAAAQAAAAAART